MPLVVYKSSAGSGKTTTLVSEYLKIALINQGSFKKILAITFTNKAANEMKQRIITTLKILADTNAKIPPNLSELVNALNLDNNILAVRAKNLLSEIIHNYDDFAISTIDSFVHRIIRTFAADVQLPQNFEVVIEDDDIIPDIIQNLYSKVGANKELTKVLINFVLAEANEENNYDPTTKFRSFIKYNMDEDGFKEISKLNNLNITQLSDIIFRLNKKIRADKSKIIQLATESANLCYDNNLEISDFLSGKNGILAYFVKLQKFNVPDEKLFPGKAPQKTINENRWFTAKTPAATQQQINNISPQLTDNYNSIVTLIDSYFYYRLIYSKIYSLALVHEIKTLFTEFTEQTGKVHISEFNKKISAEIADQPVPFIYERLGRKFQYYLIDEFQDTSVLQWYNLLPLIEESLAIGNFNMLVGDAKQAIYRFRSGEVELFSSLPYLYKNDDSQLGLSRQNLLHREVKKKNLDTNYRSFPEIIKFNNDFFGSITKSLSERTQDIYSGHEQIIPNIGKTGGLVSLNFIFNDNADEYITEKLLKIQGFVEELKAKNYKEKDICVLCRTKGNAIDIARFLIENNYNVVSSESLLLTNSPKVRLIIAVFKILVYPDNEIAKIEFIEIYLKIISSNKNIDEVYKAISESKKQGIESVFDYFNIETQNVNLITLPIYEIAEFVIREVIKQNTADIFLQYLLDYIFNTQLPLDLFINKWDDKKSSLFITMPENVDAIQIMTIHKAKGLDFNAVIVDAANIKNSNTKKEYWDDINLPEFSELKVALFPLTKKIEHINKLHIYNEEVSKTELDYLNIIYVAFTRPVRALYTISQVKSKHPHDNFSKYMINYLSEKQLWNKIDDNYSFGELPINETNSTDSDTKTNTLDTMISTKWQNIVSIAFSQNVINQSIESLSHKSYGKLIHKILAEINTFYDVSDVIKSLKLSGLLSNSDIIYIEEAINKVVTNANLKQYYKPGLIIKNETEVLLNDGTTIRPDRVIIDNDLLTILDYKTGSEKPEHNEQVKNYQNVFTSLGYSNVESKLVYIGDEINVVNLQ